MAATQAPSAPSSERGFPAVNDAIIILHQQQTMHVAYNIPNTFHTFRKPPPVNMLPQERRTNKSLQQDDHILVLPADKGRATVMMDKVQCDEKKSTLLNDQNTYERLSKD